MSLKPLLVTVGLCSSLVVLAWAVASGLTREIDRSSLAFLQSIDSVPLDLLGSAFSAIGGLVGTGAIALALTLIGIRRSGLLGATPLLMSILIVLEAAIKRVVVQEAPPSDVLRDLHWLALPLSDSVAHSFPSGHVSRTTFLALVVAGWYPRTSLYAHGFVALMGLSRVYIGSHWATDVVGGFLLGGLMIPWLRYGSPWIRGEALVGPNRLESAPGQGEVGSLLETRDPNERFRRGTYAGAMLEFWDGALDRFYQMLPDLAHRRLLDVGCGQGRLVAAARRDRVCAFGVEPYWPTPLASPHIVRGFGEALPFPDASFDAVVSFSVLAHVADPRRCIVEIVRVLREGGRAFVVVPELSGYLVLRRSQYKHLTSGQWLLQQLRSEPALRVDKRRSLGLRYLVPLARRTLLRLSSASSARLLPLYFRSYPPLVSDLAVVEVTKIRPPASTTNSER